MWGVTTGGITVEFASYQKEGGAVVSLNKRAANQVENKSASTDYTPDQLLAAFDFTLLSLADPILGRGTEVAFAFTQGLKNPDNSKPLDAWKLDFYADNVSAGCQLAWKTSVSGMNSCKATELGRELSAGDGYAATGGPKVTSAGQQFSILVGLNIQSQDPAKYEFKIDFPTPIPRGGRLEIFLQPGIGVNQDKAAGHALTLALGKCKKTAGSANFCPGGTDITFS